jgi:hypothetical protein
LNLVFYKIYFEKQILHVIFFYEFGQTCGTKTYGDTLLGTRSSVVGAFAVVPLLCGPHDDGVHIAVTQLWHVLNGRGASPSFED